MTLQFMTEILNTESNKQTELINLEVENKRTISVYTKSINQINEDLIFIGREGTDKFLYIACNKEADFKKDFNKIEDNYFEDFVLTKCLMSTRNRKLLQAKLLFLNPSLIGLRDSFGFGDRIGLANAPHIKSLDGFQFLPVLAQQSIRELTRTHRTPDDVMDAAVWAVLQEGYKGIWGADADHLKTYDDIDLMANAGYTMFTFDPSEFVDNSADSTDMDKIDQKLTMIDWEGLKATQQTLLPLYLRDSIDLENGISIPCNSDLVKRAFVKYGNAIAHIYRLYCHLSTEHAEKQYEIEISVDETESVTTPFEHFFFANELKRLGVEFVSLAPHFIGRFEKGIDYIGDLDEFKSVYQKHVAIINYFGTYKISLHSGSDKFSAYAVIGGINNAVTHVKTAGTSYLEALRVVASTKPKTFRSILDFSTEIYEDQKKTYHVSASVENIKQGSEYSDSELVELFRDNDVRQILHVAFGKVLTDKTEDGNYLFKNEIIDCLKQNEGLHYEFIKNHFVNHLKPFIQ